MTSSLQQVAASSSRSTCNVPAAAGTSSSATSLTSCLSSPVDLKDKYMLLYWYANATFNLREYKLAESLFYKALQTNKSTTSGRSRSKSLLSLVKF